MTDRTVSTAPSPSDRPFFIINAVVSTLALSLLAYLLLIRRGSSGSAMDVSFLPPLNAALNALSASFLLAGFVAIRRKAWRVHRNLMMAAFAASSLFLVSYLAFHYVHGDTHYRGTGAARGVYFFILATHVLLSMGVVPLALTAFYFAARRQFVKHKKVTRVLLPMWLYVSVTGVAVYLLLRSSYA